MNARFAGGRGGWGRWSRPISPLPTGEVAVLPQQWKPEDYPLPVNNVEAIEARKRLIHGIGNLTLVTPGFNSTLSNEPFRIKRPEIAANSSLMLNAYFQGFEDTDRWDESTIIARAETLFPLALKIWPYPD